MRSAPSSTRRAVTCAGPTRAAAAIAAVGDFEKVRQMCGHGAGNEPGRGEYVSENRHGAARCR
jgi:hypothetical protein